MEEHDRIADEREQEADRIQEPSGNLEREIKNVREDWDGKKKTESVPGAIESEREKEEQQAEAEAEAIPEPYGEGSGSEQVQPDAADASGGRAQDQGDSGDDDS